ncbi:MAG: PucR family transcriptional regulator ligand-binding domain-containing protein [Chloroflexi bacterium]|nr:PucR family transcriptional regulator ligand-binding domain-containing protein [Chloroflexota bacterium]
MSELLRLALPPSTELMAGANGSANAVTWARLLRTRPTNLGRIEPGEVWLLSSAALQLVGDGRAISRMIRDMAQAGVVAFVTSETLGPEVRVQADEAATPLLRVPHEASLAEIQRAAEVLADVRRRYWEGLLGNVSERLIVVRSASMVGQPTAVALRPLTLRGAVEGYLTLLGPADDFVDFDHQVADRAASVLAIELAKQSAVVEARLRLQGNFLTELLDSPSAPEDQVLDRARRLGYDLSRPHLVFVLRPREGLPRNGNNLPRGQQRFVDATRRRLVLADVTTLLRERDGAIQVLMPCPPDLDPNDADATLDWVERLRCSLEESLVPDAVSVVAGVGRTPSADSTPYAAMREATRAADIAASMAADSPAALHFARLGALRLIFHLADNPELRAFQRDVLGPLETSDNARRSEFVRTLEAFLRAGGALGGSAP